MKGKTNKSSQPASKQQNPMHNPIHNPKYILHNPNKDSFIITWQKNPTPKPKLLFFGGGC